MSVLLAVVVTALVLWFALFACYCYLAALPTPRTRTRARRRGGYVKPPASRTSSRVTIPPPLEPGTTGYISLRSALGNPWEGGATLAQRLGTSKPTAPGWSGNATEARGANGQQRDSAA